MENNYDSNDLKNALEVLKNGGIILYPTDTIWGIGCDATNEAAAEKIISLKQRPDKKSFVILVASEREILQHVAAPDLRVFDFLATAEKPTTVIYENAIGLAANVVAEDGSAAIRLTSDVFCRHLIKRLKCSLVSTSANISGEAAPENFALVSEAIKSGVDYIVKYRQQELDKNSTPSAIVKWQQGKPFYIRR